MRRALMQAIVDGDMGISITLSAKDLREAISAMVEGERQRQEDAARRARQMPSLTPAQAAKMLGISTSTLARREAAGEIPAVRIGAKVRYCEADLVAYMQEMKTIRNQNLTTANR